MGMGGRFQKTLRPLSPLLKWTTDALALIGREERTEEVGWAGKNVR